MIQKLVYSMNIIISYTGVNYASTFAMLSPRKVSVGVALNGENYNHVICEISAPHILLPAI